MVSVNDGGAQYGYNPAGSIKAWNFTAPAFVGSEPSNWSVKKEFAITKWANLVGMCNYVVALKATPGTFNLQTNNCTNQLINVAAAGGITLPATIGYVYVDQTPVFTGVNPGDMGEDLAATGGIRNAGN